MGQDVWLWTRFLWYLLLNRRHPRSCIFGSRTCTHWLVNGHHVKKTSLTQVIFLLTIRNIIHIKTYFISLCSKQPSWVQIASTDQLRSGREKETIGNRTESLTQLSVKSLMSNREFLWKILCSCRRIVDISRQAGKEEKLETLLVQTMSMDFTYFC